MSVSATVFHGAGTVDVHKKRIHLPKIGWVRMREALRYTGEISKVVVSRHNGRWFVSILVRCDSNNYKHQPLLFDDKAPMGIDVGINTLATCSKALSDSALSRFLTLLKYKADRRGVPITEAHQFFASSKTFSNCVHKKKDLKLLDRTYHCPECGFQCDRDLNAALNLCPV